MQPFDRIKGEKFTMEWHQQEIALLAASKHLLEDWIEAALVLAQVPNHAVPENSMQESSFFHNEFMGHAYLVHISSQSGQSSARILSTNLKRFLQLAFM